MSNIFDQLASGSDDGEPVPRNRSDAADELNTIYPANEAVNDRVPSEVRRTIQELLRQGYIESARKPDVFQHTIIHETAINDALDPLDMAVKIDSHRGIAIIVVRQNDAEGIDDDDQGWSHPLVRRQRLTLEQSLVIAILRGVFVLHEQESGVGHKPATMAVDDLLPQYLTYIGDSGSDAKNESKLMSLLDQLKGYGIVSEVDSKQEFTIRPLIAHLANPESLAALLRTMESAASQPEDRR